LRLSGGRLVPKDILMLAMWCSLAGVVAGCGSSSLSGSMDGSGCTSTFSGAFDGTIDGCTVTLSYDSGADEFAIVISGNRPTVGKLYTWQGSNLLVTGQVRTGVFDQTTALEGMDAVNIPDVVYTPYWNAAFGGLFGSPEGALSATITALGAVTSQDGGVAYESPHGSMTATLVDAITGMPDLTQTVTF
jgi:hypothetical protein